ncbi:MAG: hypothetical protein IPN33_22030 [Saprospiraceae bacterium]|nr:hypothetical protein [Saprospiraceae bacterium]
MKSLLISLLLLVQIMAAAQDMPTKRRWTAGIELDVLPYATGGYFGAVWAGSSHLRARALVARVYKPDWSISKGFTNNRVTAYALVADYFLRKEWTGWWIGGGIVQWRQSIQSEENLSCTTHFNRTMLNGSLGYNWKFYRNFYLSPWAGLHFRISGYDENDLSVCGVAVYRVPAVYPEASLKFGWHF